MRTIGATLAALMALVMVMAMAAPAVATEMAWARLTDGGYTILLRHARAPGTGDPADFSVGDCSTQRNLSQAGRQQAQKIGARIAARGIVVTRVLSSQWCRTLDTARYAFPRTEVVEEPALNSFFADRSTEPTQTAAAVELIRNFRGPGNQMLVTHQVNITALTGIVPREGEAIIVAPAREGDGIRVVARLIFD